MSYKFTINVKYDLGNYSNVDYSVSADTLEELKKNMNDLQKEIPPDKVKQKALLAKKAADAVPR